MKSSFKMGVLAVAVVLIFSFLLGCGAGRKNLADLVTEGDTVRVYEIFGMDCPGCHGGLENLINKILGVKTSQANWERQRLQVIIASGADVSDEAIYSAIKQANFTPGKRLE